MLEKFSLRVNRIVKAAHAEARALGSRTVGTEHLLLALLKDADGFGALVLKRFGVEYGAALRAAERLLPGTPAAEAPSILAPFTPRALAVMSAAGDLAEQLKNAQVGTHHLLVVMLRDEDADAVRVLRILGIDPVEVVAFVSPMAGECTESELDGGKLEDLMRALGITPGSDPSVEPDSAGSDRPEKDECGLNLERLKEGVDRLRRLESSRIDIIDRMRLALLRQRLIESLEDLIG